MDLLSSGAGLASATPWGAALGALGSALGSTPSSSSNAGPNAAGPVSVNIAGFGSRASGETSSNASQSQQPSSSMFSPSDGVGASWVLPGAIVLGLAFIALALKR